jgi:hypothetical protein
MNNSLAEAMDKLISVLEPLSPEDRRRISRAAFVLLGENESLGPLNEERRDGPDGRRHEAPGIKPQASAWLKKKVLSAETIEQYFHLDEGQVSVIALPGKGGSQKERTQACYLMAGLASFLKTDNPSFTDDEARALCTHFGCFSAGNHSNYLKDFGNKVTGGKSNGWKLTAPGLDTAAALIRAEAKPGD